MGFKLFPDGNEISIDPSDTCLVSSVPPFTCVGHDILSLTLPDLTVLSQDSRSLPRLIHCRQVWPTRLSLGRCYHLYHRGHRQHFRQRRWHAHRGSSHSWCWYRYAGDHRRTNGAGVVPPGTSTCRHLPRVKPLTGQRLRAVAGGMYLSSFYVGSTVAAWLCFGMISWDNSWAWRLPTLMQCLGSIITGTYIATGCMAESPRWLVSVGRNEQALRTLAAMHANGDEQDELVQVEFKEIQLGLQADRESKGNTYRSLVSTPGNRKRLLVLVVTAAGTQLNGTGLVSYYLA